MRTLNSLVAILLPHLVGSFYERSTPELWLKILPPHGKAGIMVENIAPTGQKLAF